MRNLPIDVESLALQIESIIDALDKAGHALAAVHADTCLQLLRAATTPALEMQIPGP